MRWKRKVGKREPIKNKSKISERRKKAKSKKKKHHNGLDADLTIHIKKRHRFISYQLAYKTLFDDRCAFPFKVEYIFINANTNMNTLIGINVHRYIISVNRLKLLKFWTELYRTIGLFEKYCLILVDWNFGILLGATYQWGCKEAIFFFNQFSRSLS